jgi:hypothetical protein
MPRTKPYTAIGIGRCKCIRCGAKAAYQWQICADGLIFRPLCPACDLELNRMVLEWANIPEWREKLAAYAERVREETGYSP